MNALLANHHAGRRCVTRASPVWLYAGHGHIVEPTSKLRPRQQLAPCDGRNLNNRWWSLGGRDHFERTSIVSRRNRDQCLEKVDLFPHERYTRRQGKTNKCPIERNKGSFSGLLHDWPSDPSPCAQRAPVAGRPQGQG